jgi:hypothetical protein
MPDHRDVASNADPYLALGVRPFVNCCGVRTLHGGTLLSIQAKQAIAARTCGSIRLPPCIVRTLQQLINGRTPSAR